MSDAKPVVGIIMGSRSDWPTLKARGRGAGHAQSRLTRPRSCRPTARPSGSTTTPPARAKRGLKVIIAGAGGAAHLPGMTASMTELPVLGVPIESRSAERPRQPAVHRPDARRRAGRHARHRRGRRGQCRPAGGADPGAQRRARSPPASRPGARRRPTPSPRRSRMMPERPLPPGSTIGILGGGQLGRMLAVAARRLGLKTHIYSDEADAPAFDVAAGSTVGSYDDEDALARFAASRRCRHLRVRERARRDAGSRCARGAGLSRRQVLRRGPGPAGREGFHHRAWHRRSPLMPRSTAVDDLQRRSPASGHRLCSRPAASAMTARARCDPR